MKSEFVLAFNEVCDEKQLPRETIIKALESAMVSAYRKETTASTAQRIEAVMDRDTGKFTIFAEKEVVETVDVPLTEVSLEDARKVNPEAEIGDLVIVESTPDNFGRVAAQTARQVIQQRIRDAERYEQVDYYGKKVGEIVNGIVSATNSDGLTIGLDKKAEATLSRKDLIRGERFHLHDRVRALIVEVKDNPRGPQIILSRTHRNFLRRLLETEVPEIYHGIVEIRAITREPGERAKIAVSAAQAGIDPVGACVGQRGTRIQTIVRELHDEKIDVIEWNPDPTVFIAKAISPARVVGVYLGDANNATVIVPDDQLSLAIGRDGQNARLAARLTNWRIDIKSVTEAASELIHMYEIGENIVLSADESGEGEVISADELFEGEALTIDAVRVILAKRTEGRPVTSEETEALNHFVDRIETRKSSRAHSVSVEDIIKTLASRNMEAKEIRALPISKSGLAQHVCQILNESGYDTFDDLYMVMKNDPDAMFRLKNLSPRNISDITKLVTFISNAAPDEALVEDEEPEEEVIETPVEEVPAEKPAEEVIEEPVIEEEPVIVPEPVEEEPLIPIPDLPEEISMEELFNTVQTDLFRRGDYSDEEGSSDKDYEKSSGKKGKKKKKGVEFEYDPDNDMTTVRRKHKRSEDDWGW